MIHQIEANDVTNPDQYRKILERGIVLEGQLRSGNGPKAIQYQSDRSDIAGLLGQEIEEILGEVGSVDVVEIGAGDGKGVERLSKRFKGDSRVGISMTGLTELPGYRQLSEMGITIYTGVVAEYLPRQWTEKFDVVATSFVLGYTDIKLALSEIQRSLRPGGVWVGLEGRDAVDLETAIPISQLVKDAMGDLDMRNDPWILGFTMPLARAEFFKYVKD